jgi:protein phosphatase
VTLRYALVSDTGMERANNEDSASVDVERGLFIVADGMGGHAAGEVASRVAVEATLATMRSRPRPARSSDEAELLLQALHDANSAVVSEAEQRGTLGMGTTLSAVCVRSRSAVIANVGDSRVYLITRKRVSQLTTDHTMVNQMVERGLPGPTRRARTPDKHVLTMAIGTHGILERRCCTPRCPRGRLLLCTDGLHDLVSEDEIASLARSDDLDAAARALVERANGLGGHDNVTVLLIEP